MSSTVARAVSKAPDLLLGGVFPHFLLLLLSPTRRAVEQVTDGALLQEGSGKVAALDGDVAEQPLLEYVDGPLADEAEDVHVPDLADLVAAESREKRGNQSREQRAES